MPRMVAINIQVFLRLSELTSSQLLHVFVRFISEHLRPSLHQAWLWNNQPEASEGHGYSGRLGGRLVSTLQGPLNTKNYVYAQRILNLRSANSITGIPPLW